jgi:hypothetical protein
MFRVVKKGSDCRNSWVEMEGAVKGRKFEENEFALFRLCLSIMLLANEPITNNPKILQTTQIDFSSFINSLLIPSMISSW